MIERTEDENGAVTLRRVVYRDVVFPGKFVEQIADPPPQDPPQDPNPPQG